MGSCINISGGPVTTILPSKAQTGEMMLYIPFLPHRAIAFWLSSARKQLLSSAIMDLIYSGQLLLQKVFRNPDSVCVPVHCVHEIWVFVL